MKKNKEHVMLKAIQNFHRVYYEIESTHEGAVELHHAAEHLFNAADISISRCSVNANEAHWKDAKENKKPAKELRELWDKINSANSRHGARVNISDCRSEDPSSILGGGD